MAPLEQVMGIEPTFSAWKADVLAVVRHLRNSHIIASKPEFVKPVCKSVRGEKKRKKKVIQYVGEHL